MGLFGKKEKKEFVMPEMPRLPELPKLPAPSAPLTYPPISEEEEMTPSIHQLPSFPTTEFGSRMSQDTIKNAVSGKENFPKFPEPEFTISTEPMEREPEIERRIIPRDDIEIPSQPAPISIGTKKVVSDEPIFIRIDKFEESMKIFEKIKIKISEIEHLLTETKEVKDKENQELNKWQEEIQKIKLQIEKVDQDIFSKIE